MFRPILFPFSAGLCLVLVLPTVALAEDELVRRVRDGHRAARESIRTLTATLTCESVHPEKGVITQARYWRSGNTARIQEGREGGHTEDLLMKGGEIRELGRTWMAGKSSPSAFAVRSPSTNFFGPGDAWREMMIEMTGPKGGQVDLDHALESADGPIQADMDKVDGRECIRLRYTQSYPTGAQERITRWHDVGRNYLIYKVEAEHLKGPSPTRGVLRVTEFVEPVPGVVFPVQVRRDHYRNGALSSATVTTLTDVVINQPIPAATFALPTIPRGTILHDRIAGKEGPVDSDWQPIGSMKPIAPPPVPPTNRAPLADATPSTSEPVSSGRWVIVGSVAILLVAAGAALARRFRNRHSAT